MNDQNKDTSTLKITRTQGQVLALLSQVLRIDSGSSMSTHVHIIEADVKTTKSDVFLQGDTPCIDEIDCQSGTAEVLHAVAKGYYYMYGDEWNGAITGTFEAKLRLFREYRTAPWKLHYVLVILPHLFGGKKPTMHVLREFSAESDLKKLLEDPGRFYSEWASGPAVDRSSNMHNLPRLSQLILNDKVTSWEELHPKAAEASDDASAKPTWRQRLGHWLLQKK